MSSTSANGIYAVSTVLPALCVVVVGLRFHARSKQETGFRFDDWAQIPALALFIGMAVIAIIATAKGAFGQPSPITPIPDSAPSVITAEKYWFALQIIQIPTLALIKIAALRFYRRIFCAARGGLLYIVHWILIALTLIWAVAFVFFYIFSCGSHVWAAWSGLIDFLQYCQLTEVFEPAYAATDFVLDTFVLFLPLPSIWRLRMRSSRKLAISSVFLLAAIGYAASIARLAVFIELAHSSLGAAPPDIQTQDTQATWFSMLEIGFATIALNMPSIWILVGNSSLDSIVRSVRSVLSVLSRSGSHTGASNSAAPQTSKRKPKNTNGGTSGGGDSSNIELVPTERQAEFYSTVTGPTGDGKRHGEEPAADLERGIRVERRVEHHVEQQV